MSAWIIGEKTCIIIHADNKKEIKELKGNTGATSYKLVQMYNYLTTPEPQTGPIAPVLQGRYFMRTYASFTCSTGITAKTRSVSSGVGQFPSIFTIPEDKLRNNRSTPHDL